MNVQSKRKIVGLATALLWMVVADCALAAPTSSDKVHVEIGGSDAGGHTVDVLGLSSEQCAEFEKLSPDQRRVVLRVYVDADVKDLPALDGKLAVVDGRLRFTPRYPLERGLRYRAVFDSKLISPDDTNAMPVTGSLVLEAKPKNPTTVVQQIYPSADVLPENQLKFYLHFSAPMSRGEAYQHVPLARRPGARG